MRVFLSSPGPRGCKPRLEAKKSARREGFSNRVGRWALRARPLELHHEPVDDGGLDVDLDVVVVVDLVAVARIELRSSSGLPARKNGARLRFNSESGSSLKSRRPSTCGFVNASRPDTEPARFKTQTCGFSGSPGVAGA